MTIYPDKKEKQNLKTELQCMPCIPNINLESAPDKAFIQFFERECEKGKKKRKSALSNLPAAIQQVTKEQESSRMSEAQCLPSTFPELQQEVSPYIAVS